MMLHHGGLRALALSSALALSASTARAQDVMIDTSPAGRQQTIDGFGTCVSDEGTSEWYQQLYFDDLRASILRVDIVPHFAAPYSDHHYNSPWYSNDPPFPGPDGNNVRTYTGPEDYGRLFADRQAEIAVMGPDIDHNVTLFDYEDPGPLAAGTMAALGTARRGELGDFKLIASMWSPAPWLKVSSGNSISGQSGNLPANGTPWPFIWGGNFAGGRLDVSGTPLAVFDDSALGGSGPTSALTQFARALAAYVRGFQNRFGVRFYAISIQNELNFEEFYNSCTYPQSPEYIAALRAAREELDKYPDLAGIRIMGPEDLLGGDAYALWQYGGGDTATHKNLQYLSNIAADPDAASAIDFFCIHGYAPDGVSSAGADPQSWDWWANGWSESPAPGIPADVPGFASYGHKSWMTETSGEDPEWLSPTSGFPGRGAFSIAVKIHQALTVGRESAWVYWQLSDGSDVAAQTLTDATLLAGSPKYVAAKHFFYAIRPGAVRVNAEVSGDGASSLLASAYVHDADGTLTVVLVNVGDADATVTLQVPAAPSGITSFDGWTSSDASYWQSSQEAVSGGAVTIGVPRYGVVTLLGRGAAMPTPDAGVAGIDGGSTFAPDASVVQQDAGAGAPSAGGCGCRAATGGAPLPSVAFVSIAFAWMAWRRARARRASHAGHGPSARSRR